jgi:hypothetical protein
MKARKSALDPAIPPPILPDVLMPGLKLVFCGTAAGTVSARRGQYYAHPQNRFWEILYRRASPRTGSYLRIMRRCRHTASA